MSDRELDAWLAEHLFGYKVCADGPCPHAKPDHRGQQPKRPAHIHQHRDNESYWSNMFPTYSTTGDGMLTVMAALKARGLVAIVKADGLRDGNFSPAYTALVGNMPRVDDKTGPLALARAAKLAIEAETAPVRERGAQ